MKNAINQKREREKKKKKLRLHCSEEPCLKKFNRAASYKKKLAE